MNFPCVAKWNITETIHEFFSVIQWDIETKTEFHLQVYIASKCSAWRGKLNRNRNEEAGWFEKVEHVHLFVIPMRLFYKHLYWGLFVCLFVSNLNSSGLIHFGSIFTNEEQKKTGSWRNWCLSPWANSVLLPLIPTVSMTPLMRRNGSSLSGTMADLSKA